MQIRGYDKRLSKRDYKLTPETKDWGEVWKVEVWNDFGMKRTVYEDNIVDASDVVMHWWESSEEEFEKMKREQKVLNNLVKKEI